MKLRVGAEARFQSGAGGRQALAAPVQAKKPLQARDESPGLVFSRQPPFFVGLAQKPKVREFIFSPLMADICRATVGDTAVLAFEQFVVKAAEKGMKFAWHQDSGYVQTPHKPYVTCWCTPDDVNEENGTVYVLPSRRFWAKTASRNIWPSRFWKRARWSRRRKTLTPASPTLSPVRHERAREKGWG